MPPEFEDDQAAGQPPSPGQPIASAAARPVPVGVARPVRPWSHPILLADTSRRACLYDLFRFFFLTVFFVFLIPEAVLLFGVIPIGGISPASTTAREGSVESSDGDGIVHDSGRDGSADAAASGSPASGSPDSASPDSASPDSGAGQGEPKDSDIQVPPPEFQRAIILPLTFFRCVITLLLVAWVLSRRKLRLSSVGLTIRHVFPDTAWGVVTTIVCLMLLVAYSFLLQILLPDMRSEMEDNARNLKQMFPPVGWPMLLLFSLAVGLFEELIFRGFIMTRLRRVSGSWLVAIVVTTVIFTIPHGLDQNLVALGPIAILAIVVSVVTIWRQSLVPAVVAHTLFNFSQLMVLFHLPSAGWLP